MNDITNKVTCYCLDSLWRPISVKTTKEAIISLCEEEGKKATWLALDMNYEERPPEEWDEKGRWNFDNCLYMNPTPWSVWVNLPVRDFDFVIHSGRGKEIRVPTVIVSQSFSETVFREVKLTKNNIRLRDGDICQYSGEKISPEDGNVDHVIPLSRGGKNVWENVVWCKKSINSRKDCKTPEEAGLKLIRKPFKPNKELMNAVKTKLAAHVDWNFFLKK